MHQRDAGTAAIEVKSRFGGRIFAADDDDVLTPVWMRLGVVVRDVRQILAGHAEPIGQVVIAGGDNQLARSVVVQRAVRRRACVRGNLRPSRRLASRSFSQAQLEFIVFDTFPIIFQGFRASGLLAWRRQKAGRQFPAAPAW